MGEREKPKNTAKLRWVLEEKNERQQRTAKNKLKKKKKDKKDIWIVN